MVAPVVFVAGLGRCGSSLTMRMLDKGELATIGTFPAYEDPPALCASDQPVTAEWMAMACGHAAKLLDPQRQDMKGLPFGVNYVSIFLVRSLKEQAKSQHKAVEMWGADFSKDRRARRATAAVLRRETRAAWKALAERPRLSLRFEQLILEPERSAAAIKMFLAPWYLLDDAAMASVVGRRDPRCAAGLDMEASLARRAHAGRGA